MRFQADRKLSADGMVGAKPGMRSRGSRAETPYPRANFLYLIRLGITASSPKRRFLSSS
jgi:hypothetical protein